MKEHAKEVYPKMDSKMQLVFTNDEINRISEKIRNNGSKMFCVDTHGLTVKDAKRLIQNLIVLDREESEIHIIHGFNHGTAIKEMIGNTIANPRINSKRTPANNPGITIIGLQAA